MRVPIIEQAKIQARILVPLIKALQTELGKDRAEALVRSAIADHYRELGARWRRASSATGVGQTIASTFAAFSEGDALDYKVRSQSDTVYEIDVTRCQYAEFFQELGEPELGFLLVCSPDFPYLEGIDADVKLTRTKTIMQGQSHCEFRYRRQQQPAQD